MKKHFLILIVLFFILALTACNTEDSSDNTIVTTVTEDEWNEAFDFSKLSYLEATFDESSPIYSQTGEFSEGRGGYRHNIKFENGNLHIIKVWYNDFDDENATDFEEEIFDWKISTESINLPTLLDTTYYLDYYLTTLATTSETGGADLCFSSFTYSTAEKCYVFSENIEHSNEMNIVKIRFNNSKLVEVSILLLTNDKEWYTCSATFSYND